MEEVEGVVNEEAEWVSSEEQEGKLEEQGQEHPRPRAPSDQPALEALVALQLELDPVNKKAQRAHARLKHKHCQRLKCIYNKEAPSSRESMASGSKLYPLVWCL